MGLKVFNIKPSVLASSKHCRLDVKYASFTEIEDWVVFPSKYAQISLSSFIEPLPIIKYKKGELESDYHLVNISDQEQRSGQLESIVEINEIGSDKNYLGDADIFVSKLGMPKGYIFVNTYKGKDILGSTEFLPYAFKKEQYQVFLKFVLLHPNMLNAYAFLESGKTPSHRRVNSYEFLKIKIPKIPNDLFEIITNEITPLNKEIITLKTSIRNPLNIINDIFSEELGIDSELYDLFGKGMTACTQIASNKSLKLFDTKLSELSKSNILRFSTRFHNEPTQLLMNHLDNLKTFKVKDIVSSFEKGIQPTYSNDGEIPVVKITNLKNGSIDFTEAEFVTQEFYDELNQVKKLRIDDIIICATGKGSLGKIDKYDLDEESLTSVDNYILRLKDNYNATFFTYFFRSILGFFQVERDYTGATNQIHLYWEQISNFLVPDISIEEQNRIANKIKRKLDEQLKIKQEISKTKESIFSIIDNYIT